MMSENKKLVPKRRFKEFQNASVWEQERLEKLATFSKGSGYSKSDLVTSGKPIILYGRLYTKYETVISDVDTFVEDNVNAVLSEGNEVIVPASGETAEDISRASFVERKGIVLGGDLNIVRPKTEIDPIFLTLNISNGSQQKEMAKRAQGKSVVHLHNSDLKEVVLNYPEIEEQQKIGAFFRTLDQSITFYQRKLEKMKALKVAYLSEMFPAEGERKPKRRFKGFTDAWEQRKLGEITKLITKGTTPLDKSGVGEISYIKVENIDSGTGNITVTSKITKDEHNGYLKRSQLKEKDILFSIAGTLGRIATIDKGILPANTNQALAIIRLKEGDLNFITTNLKCKLTAEYIRKNPTVGAQPNLSLEQVGDLEIKYPTLEEQSQIGNFFKQLDDTIALHQHKLEKLKNIKKAYLNELFVGGEQ